MQGTKINGYTLQHLLGTGGMAEVWYAENKIKYLENNDMKGMI